MSLIWSTGTRYQVAGIPKLTYTSLFIISSKTAWSKLIPLELSQLQCSKQSNPPSMAACMATVGWTWAVTCLPMRWASSAAVRNSSTLYWAAIGLLPGVVVPPEPNTLMQSAPPLTIKRTAFLISSALSTSAEWAW